MKYRRPLFCLVLFAFGLLLCFAEEIETETTNATTLTTADITSSPSSTSAATTSSAVPTQSTTEAPPKVQTFNITGEDNTTCLLASMVLEFTIPYETTENKTENAVFYLPEDVDASGRCAVGNESQLWLSFFDGKYELNFTFTEVDYKQVLDSISFLYQLDDDRFPGHAENGSGDANGEVGVALSPSDKSYSCQSAVTWTASDVKFSFTSTQIQAFNVKNGKFSDATVCPGDVTTPVPTTPAPTSLPQPEENHYVVGDDNVACLLLNAAIRFEIPYNATDGNETTVKHAEVNIPNINETTVLGTCGNTTNSIEIDFYDKWSINMIFTRDPNYTKSGTFTMQSALLSFVYDKDKFPGIDESRIGHADTADGTNLTEFTAGINKSYLCKAEQKISLGNATMHTWNLHVEPFRKTNDTDSFSAAEDCAADEKTSDIVPIAVGCALAALVVIVLVAYLIGRKRNARQGYQTV